jgi:RNA polymerase sigma factor (sigma-70 family)
MSDGSSPAGDELDRELLLRWSDGDQRAGDELLGRHQEAVRAFLRRKAGADADELAQQTFLAFLEAKGRFRHESSVRTYLIGIAQRRLYEYYRRGERDLRSVPDAGLLGEDPSSPLVMLTAVERENKLRRLLKSMPPELRVVIHLHYWDGLTGAEAAALLDVPPGTVASRLRRAKTLLREHLQADSRPRW